jgi:hypothetical protein
MGPGTKLELNLGVISIWIDQGTSINVKFLHKDSDFCHGFVFNLDSEVTVGTTLTMMTRQTRTVVT